MRIHEEEQLLALFIDDAGPFREHLAMFTDLPGKDRLANPEVVWELAEIERRIDEERCPKTRPAIGLQTPLVWCIVPAQFEFLGYPLNRSGPDLPPGCCTQAPGFKPAGTTCMQRSA